MSLFRPIAGLAGAITALFDGLTRLTTRINDRVEAHLYDRTVLLRARYAREATRLNNPLPVLEAPIDLALRGGVKKAA